MSADFITPVVDNPYTFGQIAAANALSDIYAMGGEVKSALNLLMWDKINLSKEVVAEILAGGLSKLEEAGGALLGGHTISDNEQKYGLSVTGLIHPKKIWRNNTAKIGDALILTKPLGIGILSTALKAKKLDSKIIEKISKSMATLNKQAAQIAKNFTIHSCTDITGYGLLGHLYEMVNPNISLCLDSNNIPIFKETFFFAKEGIIPGGSHANKREIEKYCNFSLPKDSLLKDLEIILFDAQTSGGLVFALPQTQAKDFLKKLIDSGIEDAKIIGEVQERRKKEILIF